MCTCDLQSKWACDLFSICFFCNELLSLLILPLSGIKGKYVTCTLEIEGHIFGTRLIPKSTTHLTLRGCQLVLTGLGMCLFVISAEYNRRPGEDRSEFLTASVYRWCHITASITASTHRLRMEVAPGEEQKDKSESSQKKDYNLLYYNPTLAFQILSKRNPVSLCRICWCCFDFFFINLSLFQSV